MSYHDRRCMDVVPEGKRTRILASAGKELAALLRTAKGCVSEVGQGYLLSQGITGKTRQGALVELYKASWVKAGSHGAVLYQVLNLYMGRSRPDPMELYYELFLVKLSTDVEVLPPSAITLRCMDVVPEGKRTRILASAGKELAALLRTAKGEEN
ncbi:hypothetical protein E3N88_24393 [Mikania micrantha]|uniref:Uncharacterized protein n=1 Tax=Mikania micrantha TaxID=192012 RepID=A0A5N6N1S5_9ASTR|nr:hypothetical protein E3N88_24393 [Mikania micrantha]